MAGSSVHARDIHGDTALQICAWANDNPTVIETVMLAGAALEARNLNGVSALQCAVDLDHYRNIEYLLSIGEDIESRDKDDDTPLFEAIRYENSESLEVLLRYGARFDYTNQSGQTALHVAAMHGSLSGMEMLIGASMDGIYIAARDSKNRTAIEAFEDRVAPPEGFRQKLEQLFGYARSFAGHEDDVDETFVDASEDLDSGEA